MCGMRNYHDSIRDSATNRTPTRIGLSDVRASLNPNVEVYYAVKWFGRPLGNLMTPAFFNAGWSAGGVSGARAGIAGLAIAVLIAPGSWWPPLAAAAFYLCFVLDCVDGNLARLRHTVSYWGKFLDGIADMVFVLGAPVAAGIGVWAAGGDGAWMLLGALLTISSLASQMMRSRLSFMREWMVNQSGPVSPDTEIRVAAPRRIQWFVAAVYVNGSFFAPLLLLAPGDGRIWYLLALVPAQMATEIVWLASTIVEARILLDRPRRSKHSPPPDDQASGSSG